MSCNFLSCSWLCCWKLFRVFNLWTITLINIFECNCQLAHVNILIDWWISFIERLMFLPQEFLECSLPLYTIHTKVHITSVKLRFLLTFFFYFLWPSPFQTKGHFSKCCLFKANFKKIICNLNQAVSMNTASNYLHYQYWGMQLN